MKAKSSIKKKDRVTKSTIIPKLIWGKFWRPPYHHLSIYNLVKHLWKSYLISLILRFYFSGISALHNRSSQCLCHHWQFSIVQMWNSIFCNWFRFCGQLVWSGRQRLFYGKRSNYGYLYLILLTSKKGPPHDFSPILWYIFHAFLFAWDKIHIMEEKRWVGAVSKSGMGHISKHYYISR